MIQDIPLPSVTERTAGFWEATAKGELRVQRCDGCGRLRHPPRPMCPWCHSVSSTWDLMSGRGTVWSFVVPHPPLLPAFMSVAPYNVVVVTLDEDPTIRLVGNLVPGPGAAINDVDPATIKIGAPVQAVFDQVADDVTLVRWMPA